MALISFINKENFEVKDELENYIYCDYDIRNIIAKLNKKGFETKFSCAGHNEVGLLWPVHKLPIDNLEEYLKDAKVDKSLHFIGKNKDYFYHKDEKVFTCIYISFAKDYQFSTLPEGYNYELVNGKSYISKIIDFYLDKEHTKVKSDIQIDEELTTARNQLEAWVDSL